MNPEEYVAKREWLRSNPTGMLARSEMRKLRAWERELDEQGIDVDEWLATDRVRIGLTPWFVGYFPDRPGQPRGSQVLHHDRYCRALLEMPDAEVREATEDEISKLRPCAWCG